MFEGYLEFRMYYYETIILYFRFLSKPESVIAEKEREELEREDEHQDARGSAS